MISPCGNAQVWVAHASRVPGDGVSPSRTFLRPTQGRKFRLRQACFGATPKPKHARRVRYPEVSIRGNSGHGFADNMSSGSPPHSASASESVLLFRSTQSSELSDRRFVSGAAIPADRDFWVAHASRVLVSVSRRNRLALKRNFRPCVGRRKVRDGETPSPGNARRVRYPDLRVPARRNHCAHSSKAAAHLASARELRRRNVASL